MSLLDFKFIKRILAPIKNDARLALNDRVDTALDKLQSQLDSVKISGEPTGFPDRTSTTMSFVDGTRTFTISPTASAFTIYIGGVSYTFNSPQSIQIPNISGSHFIYFDYTTKQLATTTVYSEDIILKHVHTTVIYWRADEGRRIYFAEERHGLVMDAATHLYLHQTQGAAYQEGLNPMGMVVDGNGSLDSHAQFGIGAGSFRDEDIQITTPLIASPGQFPVYYRIGGNNNWYRTNPDIYPLLLPGDSTFYSGTTRPAYNFFDGVNWSLQEVGNQDFLTIHILATNNIDYPVTVLLGSSYATKALARAGAEVEFAGLDAHPFEEFCLIATVIYEVKSAFGNVPKAAVVSTAEGGDFIDWRDKSVFTSGASVVPQNVIQTVAGDVGSYTAVNPTDTINIVGGEGISTTVVGNTLTIVTAGSATPTRIPVDTTFAIPVDTQMLFTKIIKLEAGARLDLDGILVEVN